MSICGRLFRVSTFGESHGGAVGCVIDGCPTGVPLDAARDIQPALDRRRPGQSDLTTSRAEADRVEILSGVSSAAFSTGSPIALVVRNEKQRSRDYDQLRNIPRPGHADFTYRAKYGGFEAREGGGRASARETIARVAAGAVAAKWLRQAFGIEIIAWVSAVGPVEVPPEQQLAWRINPPARDEVETDGRAGGRGDGEAWVRCPDPGTAPAMKAYIRQMQFEGDSCGGVVSCVVANCPAGIGEPAFDRLEAQLAAAVMSLPASKGFEIGEGFAAARMRGSDHNDVFRLAERAGRADPETAVQVADTALRPPSAGTTEAGRAAAESDAENAHSLAPGASAAAAPAAVAAGAAASSTAATVTPHPLPAPPRLVPATNHAGGVLGGISTGRNIFFRVAFKPVSSISKSQQTADYAGAVQQLSVAGRHDPCVLPRCPPLVEAAAACVLADLALIWNAGRNSMGAEGPLPLRLP